MLYFYPDLFSKVIIIDIPLLGFDMMQEPIPKEGDGDIDESIFNSLMEYQKNNINSFLNNDDELMMYNINITIGGTSPCAVGCRIAPDAEFGIGAQTGWPYYNSVRTDILWMKDGFNVPFDEWELSVIPKFPSNISMLYLYSSDIFQSPIFFEWIDNKRNDDGISEYMRINDSDHWMQVRQPIDVNTKIAQWIASTTTTKSDAMTMITTMPMMMTTTMMMMMMMTR
jgi:hypothetical protein